MTPIAGISSTSMVAAHSAPRHDAPLPRAPRASGNQASSGRALIALQPVATSEMPPPLRTRPDARFVAHLIATDQKVPQTRERRRAEPQVAITAYAATNAGPAAPTGARLSRAM